MKKPYERPLISSMQATLPNKAGLSSTISVTTDIDGVNIEELAHRHSTPLFVFSEKRLRNNIQLAKQAFQTRYPSVVFAWSYKTNYLPAVCQTFHDEGSWAEVVSAFEYGLALKNGCDPTKIIFNGPCKSDEDLRQSIRHQSLIHIDNRDEYFHISEISKSENIKARVAIRINLDAGIFPHWYRFGFNLENGEAWDIISQVAHNDHLQFVGLHCHIGTFILSPEPYRVATKKLTDLALRIEKELSHPIQYIDLGGGFASKNTLKGSYLNGEDITPSFNDYAEAITSVLMATSFKYQRPMLILETGRALVDDAGFLISSVVTHKRMSDGTSNTVIDAGVNLLFTSFWYNHKISVVSVHSNTTEETRITGPLCMNIDVIREHVPLPPLNKNDLLTIHYVGAYNVTQWMQFIQLRPSIIMVRTNGRTEVLRDKETMEDVIKR